MPSCKTIAVFPPPDSDRVSRLLQCLGAAFNVEFFPIPALNLLQHDAVLLLADDDAALLQGLALFPAVFSAPGNSQAPELLSGDTRFSQDVALAAPLRGQTLACALETRVCPAGLHGFVPLATVGDAAIWLISPERLHYRTSIPIGGLAEDEEVIDALHEYAFISVLPLVDFVRRVMEDEVWVRPDLQASLIIDDPNLHARRYGYIDYQTFADRARQIGFHACMATVPFDGWYVNSRAAEIFRACPDVLSLAVHGNDHEYKELARPISAQAANAVIAQAISRVARFEKRSGLPVARVMIPPHGVCSQTFLAAMAGAGFLGGTTTRGAVWENNDRTKRGPGSGMGLAELVGGFPIIHRFRFTSGRWRHRIAISAYLRHPLITHGHHEDFVDGLDAFDAVAERINHLGARWVSPAELFASNFESRRDGDTLWVRPYSRSMVVPLTGEHSELRIDLENIPDWRSEIVKYSTDNSPETASTPTDGTVSIRTAGVRRVVLRLEPANQTDHRKISGRRTRFTSMIRRGLSECIDRWGRRRPSPQQ